MLVDQSPIGKTTRSNPASYVGAFDEIRKLFAAKPVAKERGYTAGTFSFNSGNGRCPTCGGNGFEHVEMQFLSDVYLRCPDCDGKRYRAEILEVTDRRASHRRRARADGRARRSSSSTSTEMSRSGCSRCSTSASTTCASASRCRRSRAARRSASSSPATSRRRKPAKRDTRTLFLFDEPTTGLHFADVAKLLRAFRQLLAAGHSLVVIEHNLDVIRASDWIIDLGPEGGDAGGEIVCDGTPEAGDVPGTSHTGKALREYEISFTEPIRVKEPVGQYLGNP